MMVEQVKACAAPRSFSELLERTIELTCAGDAPRIEEICYGSRWMVVRLSDGRAGRAFVFEGDHAIYGTVDLERIRALSFAVGLDAADAARWAVGAFDERDTASAAGDARPMCGALTAARRAGFAPAAQEDAATTSVLRSFALAVANALSCRLNDPSELERRGFVVTPQDDRSFLHEGDSVVLVGAGMLLRESARTCARVDVIDMRPRASLQSLRMTAEGVSVGPRDIAFHDVEETARLVAQADVVALTGCTIGNDTLFAIARMPRRAREFVLFGPSAQVPHELLAELGVTRVVSDRLVDYERFAESLTVEFGVPSAREATEGYAAALSR